MRRRVKPGTGTGQRVLRTERPSQTPSPRHLRGRAPGGRRSPPPRERAGGGSGGGGRGEDGNLGRVSFDQSVGGRVVVVAMVLVAAAVW